MNRFWMVVGPEGNARHRHETMAQAEQEASRLAVGNIGKAFFVVQALGFYQVPPPSAPSWYPVI